MEGRFAHELYSESLSLSKIQLDGEPSANSIENDRQDIDRVESCDKDGSWYASDDELHEQSALGREWQRRHNQYHTTGYRDGVIAGKEASSQEGFNIGFKKSVLVGYNWGLVRGVTSFVFFSIHSGVSSIHSALACLPDGLKEKLIETEEQRNGFQRLFESVHSMSTKDALGYLYDDMIAKKDREQSEISDTTGSLEVGSPEKIAHVSGLGNHFAELQSLLVKCPAINVHLP
ncbi:hypothetical protein C1H46_025897 [Malus baccata]|uniref:Essential protein Yae1 N-terminal domain-containing protein n=1 Tax=Malus baccata TaxID=106549 RepID=A0A540LQA1_MALBA|nr:hypothetical protein C1H46_025897 [Malus baccata]